MPSTDFQAKNRFAVQRGDGRELQPRRVCGYLTCSLARCSRGASVSGWDEDRVNHVTRMDLPADLRRRSRSRDTRAHPAYDDAGRSDHREPDAQAGWAIGMEEIADLVLLRATPARETRIPVQNRRGTSRRGDVGRRRVLALLDEVSSPDRACAFGPALDRAGWKYAIEVERGERSLAVIRARKQLDLTVSRSVRQAAAAARRRQSANLSTGNRCPVLRGGSRNDQDGRRRGCEPAAESRRRRLPHARARAGYSSRQRRPRASLAQLNGIYLVDRPAERLAVGVLEHAPVDCGLVRGAARRGCAETTPRVAGANALDCGSRCPRVAEENGLELRKKR